MRPSFARIVAPILLTLALLNAQSVANAPALPDGGVRERLISIFIPALAEAPFTANVNTEWVKYLGNGSRITLKNHRMIARDKTGRIFQERRWFVPDNSKQESFVTQIEITDPATQQQYICEPQPKVCQLEYHAVPTAPQGQRAPQSTGQQSLGTQTIAGLEAVGTRETIVIAVGAIGNDSPIESKREFWYSKQLGLNLLSLRDDPRFGTQRFELSDITLGDPDPKLFAPPEGFKVLDLRKQTEVDSSAPPSQ
jgi:hypothetical protein